MRAENWVSRPSRDTRQISAERRVPVAQAVADGRIAAWDVVRNTSDDKAAWILDGPKQPSLILINDVDDWSTGPRGWGSKMVRLFLWSTHIVIHAVPSAATAYDDFVRLAEDGDRILIIETDDRHLEAWVAMMRRDASHAGALVLVNPPPDHAVAAFPTTTVLH